MPLSAADLFWLGDWQDWVTQYPVVSSLAPLSKSKLSTEGYLASIAEWEFGSSDEFLGLLETFLCS